MQSHYGDSPAIRSLPAPTRYCKKRSLLEFRIFSTVNMTMGTNVYLLSCRLRDNCN